MLQLGLIAYSFNHQNLPFVSGFDAFSRSLKNWKLMERFAKNPDIPIDFLISLESMANPSKAVRFLMIKSIL